MPTSDRSARVTGSGNAAVVRSRDRDKTRLRLLEAARQRFARDGYAATTVRDIATDAGVSGALISRYFSSKEGLFTACIMRSVEELTLPKDAEATVQGITQTIVDYIAAPPDGQHQLQLLLLLRSSGDVVADRIRRDTLRSFASGMATAVGGSHTAPRAAHLELRAQIALAAVLGILLLRSSSGMEPLTSASEQDLTGPLHEIISALLDSSA